MPHTEGDLASQGFVAKEATAGIEVQKTARKHPAIGKNETAYRQA